MVILGGMSMNVGYLILYALILSSTLNIIYFVRKHIRTNEAKIFSRLLFANLIGLLIEFACIFVSNYFSPVSLPAILFTRMYLIYLITYLLYMTLYNYVICYTTEKQKKLDHYKKLKKISYIIYAICFVICLALPLETAKGYAIGASVNFVYFCSTICINIWFIPIIKNRKIIDLKKFIPLFFFIFLIMVVAIIQKMHPEVTLITVMEFLIVFIMYHTIENPDIKMLDEVHKAKLVGDNANYEKSMFLYNMTSSIRGIAKDINASSDGILEEIDNKKIDVLKVSDYARNIKGDASKFITMTNEVFDISSIDTKGIKIYNDKYNVKLLLKEINQRYKNKAIDKGINFISNISSDIPMYLYGDNVGLKSVLTIILDNSIKYTSKGYIEFDVDIIIKNNIARLIITIEDSGIGIRGEDIDKLFVKGSSLYEAKRLITLMGGTIIPNSIYGKGSEVKIVLDQRYEKEEVLSKYNDVYDKRRILLIDDNDNSYKLFKKIFNNTNIELDYVKLGKEGLDKIRNKEKYDLILLDEEMEPLDGHEVMRKLREIKNFNTDVILLTKNNKYDYDDDYKEEGYVDYLIKTSKKDIVLNKINKYL